MLSQEEIAYIAGFFDGEGCIYMRYNKGHGISTCLMFTQARLRGKNLLEKIQNQLACGSVTSAKHGYLWRLTISSQPNIIRVLNLILPYLEIKKEEAILYLELMNKWQTQRILPPQPWKPKPDFGNVPLVKVA